MKRYPILLALQIFSCFPLNSQEFPLPLTLPDTCMLPFYEDWTSGSFSANGWSFPSGQGNWQIWNTIGNPEPSAKFGGLPKKTNYSFRMVSPVFTGSYYSCAEIFLEFDLKLVDFISSSSENLVVEYRIDSTWQTVAEYANSGPMDWTHQRFLLPEVNENSFSVSFRAQGSNSSRINAWYVDNIQVIYECYTPENLTGYGWGANWYLDWDPVPCNYIWYDFIFDDGSAENGWAINPGYLAWLGTEFPIDPAISGAIMSVDVWFGWGSGTPDLIVDIFDSNHTLVGSSDPFTSPSETWLNVPVPNVPFNGPFYAMIRWDMGGYNNFLGYDENGPYAATDLAWYYDGTTWNHLSVAAGTVPGVFMIRAHVIELQDQREDGDSNFMIMTGYNVFRSVSGMQGPFEKRNQSPIFGSEYIDLSIPSLCGFPGDPCYYFVTATIRDFFADTVICITSSDTIGLLYVGQQVFVEPEPLKIYPNPCREMVQIRCSIPLWNIEVVNCIGVPVFCKDIKGSLELALDTSAWPAGIYFFQIQTNMELFVRKILKY